MYRSRNGVCFYSFPTLGGVLIHGSMHHHEPTLKGQIRGFQIGPMSLENIPVVQRNKQKDFGVCGMFNYEVIHVYI
jgi:hypothetical protein